MSGCIRLRPRDRKALRGECRRRTKDRDKSTRSAEVFINLAMIQLMVNRLEKATEAAFRDRAAA
jgi:hypothetical protein